MSNFSSPTTRKVSALQSIGNDGSDLLTGSASADTLDGGLGDDTLDGKAGADKLIGGAGDDTYYVDNGGDVVTELADQGNDTVLTTLATYALGANVENLQYTGSGAFTATGNALANSIAGSTGAANKIDGGAGDDTVVGGSAADSLLGGLGDDGFLATGGKDTMDGGAGSDTLVSFTTRLSDFSVFRPNATDTVLTSRVDPNTVYTVRNLENFVFLDGMFSLAEVQANSASPGADSLAGGAGNDTLDGAAGADTMAGWLGDDTYVVDNAGDVVTEGEDEGADTVRVAYAAAATYTLGANVENATVTAAASVAVNLAGNALDNKLVGNAAANTLLGGAGNDTLDGGAGADKMSGGTGNDVYFVDAAGDTVTEGVGEGSDTVLTGLATLALAANVENLVYTGSAAFTATGNAQDNNIGGGSKGNKLDGGAGNDTLVGGDGNDSLLGGLGNDELYGLGGKDTVDGGDGADTVAGLYAFSDYTISRPTGTDTVLTDNVTGNSTTVRNVETLVFDGVSMSLAQVQDNVASPLNDKITGGDGNDTLDGGAGADTLAGGLGNDTYAIDSAGDVVQEGADAGTDLVQVGLAGAATYALGDNIENAAATGAGAVNLTGNALNNQLTGNAAANILLGGAGNDTLDGGAGADKLAGGSGNDTYVVDNSADAITELPGEGTDSVQTSLAGYTLGATVENLKYTGAAAFTGTGNALDNAIAGGNGGNKLDGGLGNDTLTGGNGADSLVGGAGDDTLVVYPFGKDTVDGGDGKDVLAGLQTFDSYTITRVSATETLLTQDGGSSVLVRNVERFEFDDVVKTLDEIRTNTASGGNDSLLGTDGADTLDGGAGADTMVGGDGNDGYTVDNALDVVVETETGGSSDVVSVAFTAAGTYLAPSNVEVMQVTSAGTLAVNLTGNAQDNVLSGNAGVNVLIGGAGNDTLIGAGGADKMAGGAGDDTYYVQDSGDLVTELAGEGTDTALVTAASYTMAANVENLVYSGAAAFTGVGNALDNQVKLGNGSAKFDGGAGNDYLVSGKGNDFLLGGLGNDRLESGSGKDTVDGSDGSDTLIVPLGFDSYAVTRPTATDTVLTDADGNSITVRGVENFNFNGAAMTLLQVQDNIAGVGNDLITGSGGNDTLDGGAGADTLVGHAGNDTYVVDNAGDAVTELADEGADLVQVALATAGTYVLGANVENGTVTAAAAVAANITGNALANKLVGNAAANALVGGAGNDTLDGGAGADKLSGGAGDDTYLVDVAGDTVTEAAGEGYDTVKTALASYTLAANVEELVYTGSAAFAASGNAADNNIVGGNGGNKIDGGAGNDDISGGSGADSLLGGAGNDAFVAGGGKDSIDGGDGNGDVLAGLGAFDSYAITRPSAADTVLTDKAGNVVTVRNVEHFEFSDGAKTLAEVQDNIVSPGNDNLRGTAGADTINGGLGNDTMAGGNGNDTYVADSAGDVVVEAGNGGTDLVQVAFTAAGTYVLGANVENGSVTAAAAVGANLTGNELNNILRGNAAANTLLGGAGNDTLDGGAGADKLAGGLGDDTYVVDVAGDTVTELAGEGSDKVETALATYALAANVEALAYTGAALFTGTGNALDNTITGGNAGNKIDGGAGNDKLTGGGGADSLVGGLGNDTLVATAGKDTLDGGDGNDVLAGLGAFDSYTITRPTAADTVLADKAGNVITARGVESFAFSDGARALAEVQDNIASPGNDNLHGGAGNDLLNGGLGNDTMTGGAGDDTYVVDNANDVINELPIATDGGGVDTVQLAFAAAGTYALGNNVDNAVVTAAATVAVNVTGNELDNAITGNAAANTLLGGAGNDTLDGGAGLDKMSGGAGDDTYYVRETADAVIELPGEGHDLVRVSAANYGLGANIEDMAYTGSAIFTGTGNGLDNVITGGNLGNQIDGGAGNDTLHGGSGNDRLLGGLGDDYFYAGAGFDQVDGGAGNNTLVLGKDLAHYTVSRPTATVTALVDDEGNQVAVSNVGQVVFADGARSIAELQVNIASPGNDSLVGTSGRDELDGQAGADTMVGLGDDDVYFVDHPGDVVVEAESGGYDYVFYTAPGSYVLAANVEEASARAMPPKNAVSITGNALDNVIQGNDAADLLVGGAGNDSLVGYGGNDTFKGGAGNDNYFVTDAGDVVVEEANEGLDFIGTTLKTYAMPANVEYLSYSGGELFTGTGNAQDNQVFSGNSGSKLDGGAGNDILTGGKGADSLLGGVGDDQLNGANGGKDTVDGGAGNDVLILLGNFGEFTISRPNATDWVFSHLYATDWVVTARNVETIIFNDGPRTLAQLQVAYGAPTNDVLNGTELNDTLNGGLGNDTMTGGAGDDTYVLSAVTDVVVEQAGGGNDTAQLAFTAAATYVMPAGLEKATVTAASAVAVNVTGNELDNVITGNGAANALRGGLGDDTLDGNLGNDTLVGGAGNDTYVVSSAGAVITELANEGLDTVQTTLSSYTMPANVDFMTYAGAGPFSGTGNALANYAYYDGSADVKFDGAAGNDTLLGGHGNDSLVGGAGDDRLDASRGGADTVDGGDGADVLKLGDSFSGYTITVNGDGDLLLRSVRTDGAQVLAHAVESFEFADGLTMSRQELVQLAPGPGNDSVQGTPGKDFLDGGLGADTLVGHGGDDVYFVDNAGDVVVEQADEGHDTVRVSLAAGDTYTAPENVEEVILAGHSAANLVASSNTDGALLVGNDAANHLTGGAGSDYFDGGRGDDTIDGGDGYDLLAGLAFSFDYTVTLGDGGKLLLTNKIDGATITTSNIEAYQFFDGQLTAEEMVALVGVQG